MILGKGTAISVDERADEDSRVLETKKHENHIIGGDGIGTYLRDPDGAAKQGIFI